MMSVISKPSLVYSLYLLVICYLITIKVNTPISPTKKMERMTFHFLLYFYIRSWSSSKFPAFSFSARIPTFIMKK